jgi:cyclase
MDIVSRTAEQVFIPLTVGGGVGSVDDVDRLLRAGADKVAVNTAAIRRPELIAEIATGSHQVLVHRTPWPRGPTPAEVTTHGGRRAPASTRWWPRACGRPPGRSPLNAMDADGTENGLTST